MAIEINGMAHVILTVSQFEAARAFYGALLHEALARARTSTAARRRSSR